MTRWITILGRTESTDMEANAAKEQQFLESIYHCSMQEAEKDQYKRVL